jgi:pyruvate formate lyase activating enzyme
MKPKAFTSRGAPAEARFHTMILGGLQKHSLIDYPGKVSCVCFLPGCNFDCPYCHNPHLVRRTMSKLSPLDEVGFYGFLEMRKGLLEGVVISGGEPTLHQDLPSLCRRIKAMGYPVKLDTNGSRPEVIKKLTDQGLVDYLAVDIKTDPSRYPHFIRKGYDPAGLLSTIRIAMEWGGDYEFRTTCVRPLVNEHVIETICRIIQGASLYALQGFRGKELLHPEYFSNIKPAYDPGEMMGLKSVAEPWVKQCILR